MSETASFSGCYEKWRRRLIRADAYEEDADQKQKQPYCCDGRRCDLRICRLVGKMARPGPILQKLRPAKRSKLIVKDNSQKGTVNGEFAVILDEPEFSETIHEEAYPRAGCADHLRQYFLAYSGNHWLCLAFLADMGE